MFFWSGIPFVRITLFLAIGIISGIYLPGLAPIVIPILLFAVIGYSFLVLKRKSLMIKYNILYGLAISFLFASLGFLLVGQVNEASSEKHIIHHNSGRYYSCKIISEPENSGKYMRMKVEVEALKKDDWQSASGKILLYLESSKNLPLAYGDRLIIRGYPARIPPPMNPKEFNYQRYLSFNNIYHQHFVNKVSWHLAAPAAKFNFIRTSILARQYLESKLEMFIVGVEELSIAKALILGKKQELAKSTREIYAQAGAMHVLAVSGLHVGVIYLVLLWLLGQRNGKVAKPLLVAIIVIPALWVYAFLTGLSPSVLRAVTMFSFLALAQVINRRSNTFNTLAISAFLLMIVNPYIIMSVGFQLSYIAVTGIIFLYPVFEKLLNPANPILRFFWQITALSLAAQLVTSPLSALYFHRFPTYFLVSNLLVIPAAMLVVWGGMALLSLGSISITLGTLIGKLLELVIWLVNHALLWLTNLPFADINNLAPTILDTWLLYGIVTFVFMFFVFKRRSYYWLAGSLILVYSFGFLSSKVERSQLRQIVFYSVSNSWAVDFIENEMYSTFADPLILMDLNKLDYLLTPHRRYYALKPKITPLESVSMVSIGEVIVWHGKRILLARSCLSVANIPPYFDYVLYKTSQSNRDCYQEQNLLLKLVNNDVEPYSVYDLNAEGALIIDI